MLVCIGYRFRFRTSRIFPRLAENRKKLNSSISPLFVAMYAENPKQLRVCLRRPAENARHTCTRMRMKRQPRVGGPAPYIKGHRPSARVESPLPSARIDTDVDRPPRRHMTRRHARTMGISTVPPHLPSTRPPADDFHDAAAPPAVNHRHTLLARRRITLRPPLSIGPPRRHAARHTVGPNVARLFSLTRAHYSTIIILLCIKL